MRKLIRGIDGIPSKINDNTDKNSGHGEGSGRYSIRLPLRLREGSLGISCRIFMELFYWGVKYE